MPASADRSHDVAPGHSPAPQPAGGTAEDPRWAGTPLAAPHWLESESGFPRGGVADSGLGPDTEILATARGQSLTRRQVDEVVAFAELLAGCALPRAERDELADDLVDMFEDSPVSTSGFLRPLTGSAARLAGMSPVERAARRLKALTSTWALERRRVADGAELSPVMSVADRHNPLLRHWASTGVVLVADALTARVEQHRLVLSLVGAEAERAETLTGRLLDRVDAMGADAMGADAMGAAEVADLAAAQVRLICIRTWLRDMGETALRHQVADLNRAVASALDVDIVVQQVGFRASLALATTDGFPAAQRRRPYRAG
jgi:hypothetical protein